MRLEVNGVIYITSNVNKLRHSFKLNTMESLKQMMMDRLSEILRKLKLKLRKQRTTLQKCFKMFKNWLSLHWVVLDYRRHKNAASPASSAPRVCSV